MIYLSDNTGQRYFPAYWRDAGAVTRTILELLCSGAEFVDQVAIGDYTLRQRFSVLDRDENGRPNNFILELHNGEIRLIPNHEDPGQ